jgi:hypothetical protein
VSGNFMTQPLCPQGKRFSTICIEGWLFLIFDLETAEKRKIPFSYQKEKGVWEDS